MKRLEFISKIFCGGFFSVFLLSILFASCASAPETVFHREDSGQEFSLLPAGARFYIWADVVKGRPLINVLSFEGMSGKDAVQILERTGSAAAAIFQAKQFQDRRFFLAATGNFPRFMANFSLAFSKGWKKQKSVTGGSYWRSQKDDIALALGSKLALVSNTDPLLDFTPEIPPAGFIKFHRDMALAGWMPNPSEPINNFFVSLGIPLQIPAEDFLFGAARAMPELWELVFRIRTPSATHARSLLSLFSLARLLTLRGAVPREEHGERDLSIAPQDVAALFFANAPEQEDDVLKLRMGPLDEGGVALLFQMFSLYSN